LVVLLFDLVGFRLVIIKVAVNIFFVTFSFYQCVSPLVCLVGYQISSSLLDVKRKKSKKINFDYQTKKINNDKLDQACPN
jgi:hypothetical protein